MSVSDEDFFEAADHLADRQCQMSDAEQDAMEILADFGLQDLICDSDDVSRPVMDVTMRNYVRILTPRQARVLAGELEAVRHELAGDVERARLQRLLDLLGNQLRSSADDMTDSGAASPSDVADACSVDEVCVSYETVRETVREPEQQRILKGLAHIELHTLFQQYGIKKVHCGSRRHKYFADEGVFGVPLQTLLDLEEESGTSCGVSRVPRVLQQLVNYLEKFGLQEEGLFRLEGQKQRVKELRRHINREGQFIIGDDDQVEVRDVATLLKQFIRDLPTPLVSLKGVQTISSHINPIEEFIRASKIPHEVDRVRAFRLLMMMLPEVNRCSLQVLLNFFRSVTANESANRMDAENLASLLAPNLFCLPLDTMKDADRLKSLIEDTKMIVVTLIAVQDQLWNVPERLLKQLEPIIIDIPFEDRPEEQ